MLFFQNEKNHFLCVLKMTFILDKLNENDYICFVYKIENINVEMIKYFKIENINDIEINLEVEYEEIKRLIKNEYIENKTKYLNIYIWDNLEILKNIFTKISSKYTEYKYKDNLSLFDNLFILNKQYRNIKSIWNITNKLDNYDVNKYPYPSLSGILKFITFMSSNINYLEIGGGDGLKLLKNLKLIKRKYPNKNIYCFNVDTSDFILSDVKSEIEKISNYVFLFANQEIPQNIDLVSCTLSLHHIEYNVELIDKLSKKSRNILIQEHDIQNISQLLIVSLEHFIYNIFESDNDFENVNDLKYHFDKYIYHEHYKSYKEWKNIFKINHMEEIYTNHQRRMEKNTNVTRTYFSLYKKEHF